LKNKIIQLGFLIALFTLSACQTNTQKEKKWVVFDANGSETLTISKKQSVNVLQIAFHNKKQVIVKQLPEFQLVLHIQDGGLVSEWLCSKSGYIKLKNDPKNIIYKMDMTNLNENLAAKSSN
jgi:hypothetical protein